MSDIGDKAFFNPQFLQLNILKGGNWYIASSYSGRPTSATIESDTQLANYSRLSSNSAWLPYVRVREAGSGLVGGDSGNV